MRSAAPERRTRPAGSRLGGLSKEGCQGRTLAAQVVCRGGESPHASLCQPPRLHGEAHASRSWTRLKTCSVLHFQDEEAASLPKAMAKTWCPRRGPSAVRRLPLETVAARRQRRVNRRAKLRRRGVLWPDTQDTANKQTASCRCVVCQRDSGGNGQRSGGGHVGQAWIVCLWILQDCCFERWATERRYLSRGWRGLGLQL